MNEARELFEASELEALGQVPDELTDEELFQDGQRETEGPRVIPFRRVSTEGQF